MNIDAVFLIGCLLLPLTSFLLKIYFDSKELLRSVSRLWDITEKTDTKVDHCYNALQKEIVFVEENTDLDCLYSSIIIDAKNNPITLKLPPARDFVGFLTLICLDGTNKIDITTCEGDRLFSNLESLTKKGDSITLKPSSDSEPDGFWFVIAKNIQTPEREIFSQGINWSEGDFSKPPFMVVAYVQDEQPIIGLKIEKNNQPSATVSQTGEKEPRDQWKECAEQVLKHNGLVVVIKLNERLYNSASTEKAKLALHDMLSDRLLDRSFRECGESKPHILILGDKDMEFRILRIHNDLKSFTDQQKDL